MMRAPFIILALPRSRTAWLSKFLSYPPHLVGHDLVVECSSIEEFLKALGACSGTVETGAMLGWRVLKQRLPEARIAIVRRSATEVISSLHALGVTWADHEIHVRDSLLDAIEKAPGVLSLPYEDLETFSGCAKLFEFCHGEELDSGWHSELDSMNIQVNLAYRFAQIRANALGLEALRQEIISENAKISGGAACLGLN